jgi:hypothetical protein
VTRAATPEAVTAATFRVDRETLTQDALGVQDIHEMRKYNTRAELDQSWTTPLAAEDHIRPGLQLIFDTGPNLSKWRLS